MSDKNCLRDKLQDYISMTEDTRNKQLTKDQQIVYCCLGLAGEAGEVIDHVKKHEFHGHDLNMEEVKNELGDVFWCFTVLRETLGFSLEEIMDANIQKLRARYPDGFSCEASRNRVV